MAMSQFTEINTINEPNTIHSVNSGLCCCCLELPCLKNLWVEYEWMGSTEVYGHMLKECFELTLPQQQKAKDQICEICISQLRNSLRFRKQVVECQAKLANGLADKLTLNILPKLEQHDSNMENESPERCNSQMENKRPDRSNSKIDSEYPERCDSVMDNENSNDDDNNDDPECVHSHPPRFYRYCTVPKCTNTTVKTPRKIFFYVPMEPKMRKKWCKLMKRDLLGPKSKTYVCEDHFDIETDTVNYIKYKLVGGILKLKPGVVPHKFDCQNVTKLSVVESAAVKDQRIGGFENVLIEDMNVSDKLLANVVSKPERCNSKMANECPEQRHSEMVNECPNNNDESECVHSHPPRFYRYCTVPKCTNTTVKTPRKIFFYVPMEPKLRKKWCKLMKRDLLGPKSRTYVCEDHFDIETDTENYVKYKLVGGILKLKPGVVPHKFDCQNNKKRPTEGPGAEKRRCVDGTEHVVIKDKADAPLVKSEQVHVENKDIDSLGDKSIDDVASDVTERVNIKIEERIGNVVEIVSALVKTEQVFIESQSDVMNNDSIDGVTCAPTRGRTKVAKRTRKSAKVNTNLSKEKNRGDDMRTINFVKARQNVCLILEHSTILPFKWNKGYFNCFYCNKQFVAFNELKLHINENHEKITSKCIMKSILRPHDRIRTDVSDITCRICSKKLDNLQDLVQHLFKEHKIKFNNEGKISPNDSILPYDLSDGKNKCSVCKMEFMFFKTLTKHMNEHSNTYVCHVCGKCFLLPERLRAHTQFHTDMKAAKCELCEKVFTSNILLRSHVRYAHEKRAYVCSVCNETFQSYRLRTRHLEDVHGRSPLNLTCKFCSKELGSPSNLSAHVKSEHMKIQKEAKHGCSECGKMFKSRYVLKCHAVVHSGERNFQCDVCQKKYTRARSLGEHLKIHMNDKRWSCGACAQAFVQKCSLKNHIRVHHGDTDLEQLIIYKKPDK